MENEYVHPWVVGIMTNLKGEFVGKTFRGSDAKEKSKEYYMTLVDNKLNCFRAEIREEHGEG